MPIGSRGAPVFIAGRGIAPQPMKNFYWPTRLEEYNRNLLSFSEQLDNVAWTRERLSAVTADTVVAPDGTLTADKLVEDTATGTHDVYIEFPLLARELIVTSSFHVKAAGRNFAVPNVATWAGGSFSCFINLTTGAITNIDSCMSTSSTDAQNGWWRVSVTGSLASGAFNPNVKVMAATAAGTASYTGDGASGIYVWGAQFERGSLSEYKAVPTPVYPLISARPRLVSQAVNRASTY